MKSINVKRSLSKKNIDLKILKKTTHLLAGKWKLEIVGFLLVNDKTRFMDLQRGVTGISSKVLSNELQYLEKNKILQRIVRDDKLSVVEYELTESGKNLKDFIFMITVWGIEHFKIICDID